MSGSEPNKFSQTKNIIRSHKLFINYLNSDIVNKLIQLFDNDIKRSTDKKIINYIEDERHIQGSNRPNIRYESKVDLQKSTDPTLILEMIKNNTVIFHFTIHLAITSMKPKKAGIIHIRKNIYDSVPGTIRKKVGYARILVTTPLNKPYSLHFSFEDNRYIHIDNCLKQTEFKINTELYKNIEECENEIQKEMNIVLNVLNKLFDEDNTEYYIGNNHNLAPIHNKTNTILNQMNKETRHATRKNKGVLMGPFMNNSAEISLGKDSKFHMVPRTLKKSLNIPFTFQSSQKRKTTRKVKKTNK